MRSLVATFFVMLTLGFAVTAQAEPPTIDQLAEFQQLVDGGYVTSVEFGEFLEQNRSGNTYTVKRRCDLVVAIKMGKSGRYFTPENFHTPDGCVEGEEVEVRLFSPQKLGQEDSIITTREAKAEIGKRECRPADWTLLLPLGEKYPELQRKFWIVGLGSAWRHPDGFVLIPILYGLDGRRSPYLDLSWDSPGRRWGFGVRFAASCE